MKVNCEIIPQLFAVNIYGSLQNESLAHLWSTALARAGHTHTHTLQWWDYCLNYWLTFSFTHLYLQIKWEVFWQKRGHGGVVLAPLPTFSDLISIIWTIKCHKNCLKKCTSKFIVHGDICILVLFRKKTKDFQGTIPYDKEKQRILATEKLDLGNS